MLVECQPVNGADAVWPSAERAGEFDIDVQNIAVTGPAVDVTGQIGTSVSSRATASCQTARPGHCVSSGYRATSLDAVAEAARFTKGALYRHFTNKEAVFTAVPERVQRESIEQITLTPAGPKLEWPDAMAAVAAYLDVTTSERFRRIVLEEAPESSAGRAGASWMIRPRAGSCVRWWSGSQMRASSSQSIPLSPADSSAPASPKPPWDWPPPTTRQRHARPRWPASSNYFQGYEPERPPPASPQ